MKQSERIYRPFKVPIRKGLSWEEYWRGDDAGLIKCWEVGRKLSDREPELAERAKKGELPVLGWKGGVAKKIKKKEKYGTLLYLAQWQGLRGEDLDVEAQVRASPLHWIPLVAPTTEPARAKRVLDGADGFVYVISRLGVTGAETQLDDKVEKVVARVRSWTDLPVALGFGIASGEQAAVAARYADGVVVGSALVRALGDGIEAARHLTLELRVAIDAL